jgi:glucosylceramidase
MYYYVGHISRHVRPGARALSAIVDKSDTARAFRPLNSGVSGGGMNDLAREGIEATLWPCEGSTRQEWKLDEFGRWKVFGHDWLGKPTTSCLAKEPDRDFHGLLLTSCSGDSAGVFNIITRDAATPETNVSNVNIVLTNGESYNIDGEKRNCLRVQPLQNEGGTYGQRGGAQVTIGDCNDSQVR